MTPIKIYNSILSNIDDTIKIGDEILDPFSVLNIQYINIDSCNIINFCEKFLDINKLNNTINFNNDKWCYLEINMKNNVSEFIPISLVLSEDKIDILLKFIYWICYEILYTQKPFDKKISHDIDISNILNIKYNLIKILKIYIHKIFNSEGDINYCISILLPTNNEITIVYKNKIF